MVEIVWESEHLVCPKTCTESDAEGVSNGWSNYSAEIVKYSTGQSSLLLLKKGVLPLAHLYTEL